MSLSFFSRGAPDPPSTAVPSSSSSRSEPSRARPPLLPLASSLFQWGFRGSEL
ncbi:hypothetical protein JHK84_036278 [Glycine max]|nr:hypothetical protein JHK84_036278 [Glycine max]